MIDNPWGNALMQLNDVVESAIAASAGVRLRLIDSGFNETYAEQFAMLHLSKLLDMIYNGIERAVDGE